ncbi:hypothetical protein FDN00_16620 [Acinetobacter baumannii]|nr:hypothetical protein [Acinetobacter baumannii]QCP43362.1 hypothetical protein FDN00_16620 [Acinetobacter baumannii]
MLDPINATDPVSGQAEPGSQTVTYPDGTTATVVAGTDGSWSVPNPGNSDRWYRQMVCGCAEWC